MGQDLRRKGMILIHVTVACYMFYCLALVCDDFFLPALELLTERLQLTDDVAGATFMAAGSSAPELFTSLIGVFVTKDDVGTGTIVGSGVFNVLCATGIVSLCVRAAAPAVTAAGTTAGVSSGNSASCLRRWPVIRDAVCYAAAVIILILVCLFVLLVCVCVFVCHCIP